MKDRNKIVRANGIKKSYLEDFGLMDWFTHAWRVIHPEHAHRIVSASWWTWSKPV